MKFNSSLVVSAFLLAIPNFVAATATSETCDRIVACSGAIKQVLMAGQKAAREGLQAPSCRDGELHDLSQGSDCKADLYRVAGSEFDLAACSDSSDGRLIVRLAPGLAFALAPESGNLYEVEADPAGDSQEPRGCPANPLRTHAFFVEPSNIGGSGDFSEILRAAGMYGIKVIGNNLTQGLHETDLARFSDTAERLGNCSVTQEGISICYFCRVDPERPPHCEDKADAGTSSDGRLVARAGFLALDPQNQTGFDGQPWTASCHSEFPGGSRFCYVSYVIEDGLGLSYRFGRGGMDINALRALDEVIRQGVLALRVPQHDGGNMQ